MITEFPKDGRRGSRLASGRQPRQFSPTPLLVLMTICAALFGLFELFKRFPLPTLIFATMFVIAGLGIILYIGELVVIGWVVDFLSLIGRPKSKATAVPLEYERVGDIIVVTLRDNIATPRQCQSVQKDLKQLIDEHHCDFVLDFFHARRISRGFRGVMVHLKKAARREAERLGYADRSFALLRPDAFSVFDDRQCAVEEMKKSGEHGWVVLCSVPVGIRAVFG